MFSWFTVTKQKRYVKATSRKGRLGQMAMDGSKGLAHEWGGRGGEEGVEGIVLNFS